MQEDSEINPRCPKVSFSEAELKSFYRPWSKALVVKVLEKSFSFGAVKRRLESLWARKGCIQVSDIANSFFLVRFSDSDDYQWAAFGGPWKMAMTQIGNCIGKTVKLDLATSEGARARYARVCMEVDISKPLLGKYMIENRTFFVEYESFGNICVTCGFHGHKTEGCTISEHAKPSQGAEMSSDSSPTDQEGDAGEWMVVQRRNRGKGQKEK
ncbi:hypothetical protein LINPERHAP1_LOCUS41403 [Linum perenne]